ncbi:MAG: hypothetical protein Q9162_007365, partial [Coniocarpon cinnabarinum]
MLDLKSLLLSQPGIRDLALFRRQYLQRYNVKDILWPTSGILSIFTLQQWIWAFVSEAQATQPFPQYDRAFLKELQTRIESAVEGTPEPDVVDEFAELYVKLDMEVSQAKARDDEYVWIQYTPPWHELDPSKPERGFYVLEKPLVLSASGSTGHRTWEAALHLAGWLEDGALVNGKRVLELGAGTALLSLLAAQKGALSITATDGD